MKAVRSILRVLHSPTDEFEEVKYRKTWYLPAAGAILIVWFLAAIADRQLTGFAFNRNNLRELNILFLFASTVLLFCLYAAVNWAVTTLLDGKGTLREIFCASAYALLPYVACTLLAVVFSRALILEESAFLTIIRAVGLLWSGWLLLAGLKVVHEYSLKKTVLSLILTVLGMLFVLVLGVLFFSLLPQLWSFVLSIYNELLYRS